MKFSSTLIACAFLLSLVSNAFSQDDNICGIPTGKYDDCKVISTDGFDTYDVISYNGHFLIEKLSNDNSFRVVFDSDLSQSYQKDEYMINAPKKVTSESEESDGMDVKISYDIFPKCFNKGIHLATTNFDVKVTSSIYSQNQAKEYEDGYRSTLTDGSFESSYKINKNGELVYTYTRNIAMYNNKRTM